jgi:hypothetical protein
MLRKHALVGASLVLHSLTSVQTARVAACVKQSKYHCNWNLVWVVSTRPLHHTTQLSFARNIHAVSATPASASCIKPSALPCAFCAKSWALGR